MRIAEICPTCATYINAACVIYDGPYLSNIDVSPLDPLDQILGNINDNLVPVTGTGAPTNNAVYIGQLYVDTSTGDIYYAVTTGSGPADWVLFSSLFSVPTLQQVLTAGNTATNQTITMNGSAGYQVFISGSGTNSYVRATGILGGDNISSVISSSGINIDNNTTGLTFEILPNGSTIYNNGTDQLEIVANPANYNNNIITYPSGTGYFALSVNGNTADATGDITLTPIVPSLDDVTSVGNNTANQIFTGNVIATDVGGGSGVFFGNYDSNFSNILLGFTDSSTGYNSKFEADVTLSANRTYTLPNNSGTLALSVNGNYADSTGNITVSALSTPTLQQVLNNNHDLVDGNNFQGTGAGSGNTGVQVTAIGTSAAINNTNSYVVGIGYGAASNQSGFNVVGVGINACGGNSANSVIGIGNLAVNSNTGIGVYGFGDAAAWQNTGSNVVAIGANAGISNPLSGMFIISNLHLPSYVDHAAAVTAISPTGIIGNTYIYHNQSTNSIGAVRL